MPSSSGRWFFALWPPPDVRASFAAARDAVDWSPTARCVATDKLHLTLHFIGTAERSRIALLRDSLELRFSSGPFELSFGRFELWPGGIAVWRPHETPPALCRLRDALGDVLTAFGFACERRFEPHVTFARHASAASFRSAPPAPIAPLRWRVDGFALVESRLGTDGGYSVVRQYHL